MLNIEAVRSDLFFTLMLSRNVGNVQRFLHGYVGAQLDVGEYVDMSLPQGPSSPNNRLHLQPLSCLVPTESVILSNNRPIGRCVESGLKLMMSIKQVFIT